MAEAGRGWLSKNFVSHKNVTSLIIRVDGIVVGLVDSTVIKTTATVIAMGSRIVAYIVMGNYVMKLIDDVYI